MVAVGDSAPDFELGDQFGRKIPLSRFRDRRHVALVFYPLDFTPT